MKATAMNTKTFALALALCCGLLLATDAPRALAQADAPSGVAVSGVQRTGSTVTGWVSNETNHEVRDLRLMVQQDWRWAREMKPGDDNPGTSDIVRVPQAIPPGGKVQFRYDMPQPLPERGDGHFVTNVKVLSFSEHWMVEPSAAVERRVVP